MRNTMDPETQGVEVAQPPVQAEVPPETVATPVTETPTVETPQGVEDEFPTEPDKQREAFIKMRQEIKALKEQPETPVTPEEEAAVLNQFRQRQVPQTVINPQMGADEQAYQMQQLANQSQMTAQQVADLQQQLEDERLYNAFPELNPSNPDFKKPENRAFERLVAGMYVTEQLRGNNPNLVELARKAKADFDLLTTPQQQAAAEEATQTATRAEQATLEARGSHSNVPAPAQNNDEALRLGARKGDPKAIAELLKRG